MVETSVNPPVRSWGGELLGEDIGLTHIPQTFKTRVKVASTPPTKYPKPQRGALRKQVPTKSAPYWFQVIKFIRVFGGEQATLMPSPMCSEDSGPAAYFLKRCRSRKHLKCFKKSSFLGAGGFRRAPVGFSGSP